MNSIIVPVYNRPQLLRRAAESVLAQTYRNFELILVDDGSTDDTLEECKRIQQEHPEAVVRIISNEHNGVSAARNAGLDAAEGSFVSFLDSDDEIDPLFLEHLMAKQAEHNADWVYCSRCAIFEWPTHSEIDYHFYDQPMLFRGEQIKELIPDILFRPYGNNLFSTCMSVYRKEILDAYNIRFSIKVPHYEDVLFNYEFAHRINCFCYITEPLYRYHIHDDSISKMMLEDALIQAPTTIAEYERVRNEVGGEISQAYLWRMLNTIDMPFRSYLFHKDSTATREERAQAYRQFEKLISQEPARGIWEQLSMRKFLKTIEPKKAVILWCLRNKRYELLRFLYRSRTKFFDVAGSIKQRVKVKHYE